MDSRTFGGNGKRVGQRLPAFELEDHRGGTVSSAALKGQPFVLFFYPSDSSPGWTDEARAFAELYPQFRKSGAEVFGVSANSARSHVTFATKQDLPFGLLVDKDWQYRLKLGTPEPTGKEMKRITFVVNAAGVIRLIYYYEGREGVASHAHEALAAVRKLRR